MTALKCRRLRHSLLRSSRLPQLGSPESIVLKNPGWLQSVRLLASHLRQATLRFGPHASSRLERAAVRERRQIFLNN